MSDHWTDGESEGGVMFDVYCPRHGSRVMLTTRRIQRLDNDCEGLSVRFRCWCGYEGVWRPRRSSAALDPMRAA